MIQIILGGSKTGSEKNALYILTQAMHEQMINGSNTGNWSLHAMLDIAKGVDFFSSKVQK